MCLHFKYLNSIGIRKTLNRFVISVSALFIANLHSRLKDKSNLEDNNKNACVSF